MPSLVTLDRVAFSTPDGRVLFEDLTLALRAEKTGLVGRNGAGKTTLARLILGELAPAAGTVSAEGRIATLRQQHAPPPGARLKDLIGVAEGLDRLARLERGEGAAADLEAVDWSLPQRAAEALAEMGLGGLDLETPADALSGGQATRAALAALLVAGPDMLVLDEPTNNLDAEGRALVAAMLHRWPGAALVISHDRALLTRMDRIVELTGMGAKAYGGGYDHYAAQKAAAEAAAERRLQRAEADLARTEGSIQAERERKARRDAAGRRSRAPDDMPKLWLDAQKERAGSTSHRLSRAADRRRSVAAAELGSARAEVEIHRSLGFDLPPSGLPNAKLVLAVEHVSFAWPGEAPLLVDVSFRIVGPQRLALTGPNGAGKTTLIRLAAGELSPSEGLVRRGAPGVRLDQRAALAGDGLSLIETFRRLNPASSHHAAHAALAGFLFRNADALKPAEALSGGERLRAALACALMAEPPPQLIILDEPTNHLDLASVLAVERALAAYDGALLVASHDAAFLAAIGAHEEVRLGG